MSFAKFRKKPVIIEAVQFIERSRTQLEHAICIEHNDDEIAAFIGKQVRLVTEPGAGPEGVSFLEIETLEGTMRASVDDYIIKGVKGEFYPCKPDIFAATYSAAAAEEVTAPGSANVPEIRIHLINRRLGYGANETVLQGYSGARWGGKATSRFSPAYGCHFIDLSLEEYEACREDVFKAAHLSARVWEPKVVVKAKDEGGRMKDEVVGPPKSGEGEKDYEAVFREFWAPICCDDRGALIQDKIMRELFDFHVVMGNVGKVYDHITRGRISKIMTNPESVIAVVDDLAKADLEEALREQGAAVGQIPDGVDTPSRPDVGGPSLPIAQDDQKVREQTNAAPPATESGDKSPHSITEPAALPVVDARTPYAKLLKIAKEEGAPWKDIKNSAALLKSINAHRQAMIDKQKDLIARKPQGAQA